MSRPCGLSNFRLVTSESFWELGPNILSRRSFITRYWIITLVDGGIIFSLDGPSEVDDYCLRDRGRRSAPISLWGSLLRSCLVTLQTFPPSSFLFHWRVSVASVSPILHILCRLEEGWRREESRWQRWNNAPSSHFFVILDIGDVFRHQSLLAWPCSEAWPVDACVSPCK